MSESAEIFSLSALTPERAWVHGAADARAWFTGSLRADDSLDFSAEFDVQARARLGADVASSLGSVQAEAQGAAHAGARLQLGMPLDLFEGAGLLARLRLEASVSGQLGAAASMTTGALGDAVLAAVPAAGRPYAEIILDEATLSAGAWARGSFAVMASAELVSTVSLFPSDGSPPGLTAYLRYGYAWGFGGGWGTVVNVGLDPDRLIPRVTAQLSHDLRQAVGPDRAEPAGTLQDWLLAACPALLPAALRVLVDVARASLRPGGLADMDSVLAGFLTRFRSSVADWLLTELAAAAGAAIAALDLGALDPAARRAAWEVVDATTARRAREAASPTASAAAFLDVLALAIALVEALGAAPAARAPLRALRCAAALSLLIGPDVPEQPVAKIFGARAGAGRTQHQVAVQVVTDELIDAVNELGVLPDWMTTLLGTADVLVPLVLTGRTGAAGQDAALAARIARALVERLVGSAAWREVADTLLADVGSPLVALVHVLDEFCAAAGPAEQRARHLREGVSVCLLSLVGTPLSHVVRIVADTGLRAAPAAFRHLADEVDGGRFPADLSWSWSQVARAGVGVSTGLPTAAVLRKTAASVENWCDVVLPEELDFLTRSLRLGEVCAQVPVDGAVRAIAQAKQAFLLDLAGHTLRHLLDSIEFALHEGRDLVEAMFEVVVASLLRSHEATAIAAFKAFEDSITLAEQLTTDLQVRADELERGLAEQGAALAEGIRGVAQSIRHEVDAVEDRLVTHVLDTALAQGSGRGVERAVLEAVVRAGIDAATGGLSKAVRDVTSEFARVLELASTGLAAVASSSGAPRGARGLLQSTARVGAAPTVSIPVTVAVPNPALPGILPDIRIELFTIQLPAEVVGRLLITAVFDVVGVGPLLDALDLTVASLAQTRIALEQTRALIAGRKVAEQRTALAAARASGPLSVTFVSPEDGAATTAEGEVVLRVAGANLSHVRPQAVGAPVSLPERVVVRANGAVVTGAIGWQEQAGGLLGTLRFSTRSVSPTRVFVGSPLHVVVTVADETGRDGAHTSRLFVPQALPNSLVVSCIRPDGPDPGSGIDAFGGVDLLGRRWMMPVRDALLLYDQGTRFFLAAGPRTYREIKPVWSRTGRRYFRTIGRGGPVLGRLPRCR